jgi:anaerobic magnesium-protoporphyrin IX monomethyl ester cyclase
MKILLINPPAFHLAVTSKEWMTTAEDIGSFPPIGLMYIAGSLRASTDSRIEIIDMVLEQMSLAELGVRVRNFDPDIVGITAFTPMFYDVMEVVKLVKSLKPHCHLCVGGAHAGAYPLETIAKPEIDSILLGESEHNFVKLVHAIEKGEDLRNVPGLICKDAAGGVSLIPQPGYIPDINTIAFPAFDLLPFNHYFSAIGTGNPVGTISSSRGCPYECTFCCKPYRTYRMRSPGNIIREMKLYYEKGIREFFFFDDMFNINPGRVAEISEAILHSGMHPIVWSFRGRVDQVSEAVFRKAKESGCRQVLFGVETATDEGLRLIKKKITTKQVMDAVRMARVSGLETNTNWIIGFPHHRSKKDIEELIHFARRVDSDYAQFNILIPYEGTEIYEQGVRQKVLERNFWRDYTVNPVPHALIPVWDEFLSREELSGLLRLCYAGFYFRPHKILKNMLTVKSFGHLMRKIKGATVLLGLGGYRKRRKSFRCT